MITNEQNKEIREYTKENGKTIAAAEVFGLDNLAALLTSKGFSIVTIQGDNTFMVENGVSIYEGGICYELSPKEMIRAEVAVRNGQMQVMAILEWC